MVSIKELDKNELQLYCKELERNTFPPTKVGGFSATKPVLPDLANSVCYVIQDIETQQCLLSCWLFRGSVNSSEGFGAVNHIAKLG